MLRYITIAPINLSSCMQHFLIVVISIINTKEVKYITSQSSCTTSISNSFYWHFVHKPSNHINIVNSLIKNMITTKPFNIKPIAYTILHVTPLRKLSLIPPRTLVPMRSSRNNLPYQSIL